MYLSLYCKGSKRVTQGFTVRESWRPNRTAIYWPTLLWPSALCLSPSPGLLNRRPRGSALRWMMAFFTASYHQQVSETTGGPEGSFGREWLSLPHLISNFSGPQLNRGPRGPLMSGMAFPTTSRLQLQLSDFLSWPSYIIVQRPFNRLLNLWNGMFDRHQAEITVMQFPGHSLPVHQSMSVPWDFFFFYLVLFHQPNPAYAISFDYWSLGCVTSVQCITLEWHICPGRRSKYNSKCAPFGLLYRQNEDSEGLICH